MGDWPGLPSVKLQESELSGTAASFDFTSIPTGFSYLVLLALIREDDAVTNTTAKLRFNNDSAGNYDTQTIRGNQATAAAIQSLGQTSAQFGSCSTGASATANLFSFLEVKIYNYTSTVEKIFHFQGDTKSSTAAGNILNVLGTGWWRSTAVINQITLLPNAGNWIAGSKASLYAYV